MVRMRFSVVLNYQVQWPGADFVFNVQAAHTPRQRVVEEQLRISQPVPTQADVDPATHSRWLRLRANGGPLQLAYSATVDLSHHRQPHRQIAEVPVAALPGDVLPYLYPSRYCESDRLNALAVQQFGSLWQGYERVLAIRDWVRARVVFKSNTSSGTTSACDTLISGQGVCRDFAHLMIALCRAVNIPARFATGFDYGSDPALGPPDFHAYVEAYLGGRWYLFDPSGTAVPMGLVRLATGRDAADAAFATIFGAVQSQAPVVLIEAMPGADGKTATPVHVDDALSTDGALA